MKPSKALGQPGGAGFQWGSSLGRSIAVTATGRGCQGVEVMLEELKLR